MSNAFAKNPIGCMANFQLNFLAKAPGRILFRALRPKKYMESIGLMVLGPMSPIGPMTRSTWASWGLANSTGLGPSLWAADLSKNAPWKKVMGPQLEKGVLYVFYAKEPTGQQ